MSQDMSMVPAVNQCKSNRETETYFQQLIRFVTKKFLTSYLKANSVENQFILHWKSLPRNGVSYVKQQSNFSTNCFLLFAVIFSCFCYRASCNAF